MDLASLLSAAQAATDPAARQQAVRDALQGAQGTLDLAALEKAAAEEFARLSADDSALDEAAFETMGALADVVDAARAHAAESQQARVNELSERLKPSGASSRPVTPQQPQTPEQPEPGTDPQPGTGPQDDPGDGGQPQGEPIKGELVTASGTRAVARPTTRVRNTVPLGALPVQLPAARGEIMPHTITAAADLPGFNLGQELTVQEGLVQAVMARFTQLGRAGGDSGGGRQGIASINIERDERLIANSQHDYDVVEFACDETRLPGGSLLASADPGMAAVGPGPAATPGWCAPCEVSWSFCPPAIVDGLVDLPTVTARRGCLIYPQSPDFSAIYSGIGWCYTPDQIDNMQLPHADPPWDGQGTPPPGGPWYNPTVGPAEKDCYKIPCPPTNQVVLEPCGICLQASILTERAYPELIRYTVEQALVAFAHKMNCKILSQMEGLADVVDLKTNANLGPGATAVMLEAIEMQVEWLRYRYRLGVNATMEMIAPHWMRPILRADLSKRTGVDMLNVTNETLDRYLRDRGVRIQWVLDWQDAFCDPITPPPTPDPILNSTLFGGNASRNKWPLTGKVLIYPAGTFFLARMDIINLEAGLLDSTLLRRNERMVLFAEEALAVGKRCYTASLLEFNLCPSGQTGSTKAIACAATAGA